MELETKSQSRNRDVWMEIKFVVEPEEYKFLQEKASLKEIMVSDLIRQIVLSYIGNERKSL